MAILETVIPVFLLIALVIGQKSEAMFNVVSMDIFSDIYIYAANVL